MNKMFFRLLVVLMSLSLIGIILVQVYWFNSSFRNNDDQFRYQVTQVIADVADKLQKNEEDSYRDKYKSLKDSIGKEPEKSDFIEYGYYQRDSRNNETIIYSSNIMSEDFNVSSSFFDKKTDSLKRLRNFSSSRVTEIYNNGNVDNTGIKQKSIPDFTIKKSGNLDILDKAQFEIFFKDLASLKLIQDRVSVKTLNKLLSKELKEFGVETPYEFCVYSNGLSTKVRSENFKFDKNATFSLPFFTDNDGNNQYQLLVSFPHKKRYLFSELLGITILSIVFTLIIIVAYSSALNQLIRQRQISEIKTDFITP